MDSAFRPRLVAESERMRAAYAKRAASDPRYSWFTAGQQFLLQQRERAALRLLASDGIAGLDGLRVLELGCGNANWLRDLVRWGGTPDCMTGVDLIAGRLREAVRLGPPGAGFAMASGAELPFRSGAFDLVLQSTVFSSILDSEVRSQAAAEILRVLAPSGRVLWYDYHLNNPANPDVRGVPRPELRALFPGCTVVASRTGLAPPIARRLARWSWIGCLVLERVPLLRSHTLALIRRSER